jgi:putative tryptophan/tyrosine transport system substrate-binding protein
MLLLGAVMRRREFLGVLGSAAAAWPLAARAQQPAMPVIGFLHTASAVQVTPQLEGFRRGLAESGYVMAQDVAIEYRWADGHFDRLPALAAELVQRRVTVLISGGGPKTALAVKAATSEIPILFVMTDDPVKHGVVASLNRPGGNITGATFFSTALVAKRLELLRELVPAADGIVFLTDPNDIESELEARDVQSAAQAMRQQITILKAANVSDLDAVFAGLVQPRTKAILVGSNVFFVAVRDQLAVLAARYAVPIVYPGRLFVASGGLASYGTSLPEAYRQIGLYAGRILKGEKPANLPVVQPTKFETIVNLKTAKALGLVVPYNLLARADEVIE